MSLARTRWNLGWYLCIEFSIVCNKEKSTYIGTDCFILAVERSVCNYFASRTLRPSRSRWRDLLSSPFENVGSRKSTKCMWTESFFLTSLFANIFENKSQAFYYPDDLIIEAVQGRPSRAWESESDLRRRIKVRKHDPRHVRAIVHEEKYREIRQIKKVSWRCRR